MFSIKVIILGYYFYHIIHVVNTAIAKIGSLTYTMDKGVSLVNDVEVTILDLLNIPPS